MNARINLYETLSYLKSRFTLPLKGEKVLASLRIHRMLVAQNGPYHDLYALGLPFSPFETWWGIVMMLCMVELWFYMRLLLFYWISRIPVSELSSNLLYRRKMAPITMIWFQNIARQTKESNSFYCSRLFNSVYQWQANWVKIILSSNTKGKRTLLGNALFQNLLKVVY